MPSIIYSLTLVFQTLRPSWWAKPRLITLTLLPQFSITLVYSLKVTEYQIQGNCSNFSSFLLVIGVEVIKIATSFLAFQGICLHSNLFVYRCSTWYGLGPWLYAYLFCYLGDIDPNSWIISLLFFLIFLKVGGLGLRLISGRKKIVGLSLFFISGDSQIALLLIGVTLVFFDQQPVFFWISEIAFFSPKRWLKTYFCFCIDSFLYYLVPHIEVPPSII